MKTNLLKKIILDLLGAIRKIFGLVLKEITLDLPGTIKGLFGLAILFPVFFKEIKEAFHEKYN